MFASVGIPLKTTYFYDLGTAIGFCATAAFSIFYPVLTLGAESAAVDGLFDVKTVTLVQASFSNTVSALCVRQIVMAGMISIWAIRFGSLHFTVSGLSGKHGLCGGLIPVTYASASSNTGKTRDSTTSSGTPKPLPVLGLAKRLGSSSVACLCGSSMMFPSTDNLASVPRPTVWVSSSG